MQNRNTFEDLTSEQKEMAARLFWEIAEDFVFRAEPGMLVTFCLRHKGYEYASLLNLLSEGLIECSVTELFDGIANDHDADFAELIKPLVLDRVRDNFGSGIL